MYQDTDPWGLKQEPIARQDSFQQQEDWLRPQDVTGPQLVRRILPAGPGLHQQSWPEVALAKAINNSDGWACTDCQYRHRRRGYLLNHIEKEHMPPSFPGYECVRYTTFHPHPHNPKKLNKKHNPS